ncbi:lamin tail domain-containing protein [Nocardioides sp. BP30]|uniref:lamin tail domain-containing protein n=1 Tax=Nocardioides sp. BP30 TaxID=3036374 RepID=UPI00246964A8|nr:lamin tail domain-containing protein [Nocardioides sp. BP30]WGL53507.1 lamin tail domain-containing protein [Nocardioides sp. BP30]
MKSLRRVLAAVPAACLGLAGAAVIAPPAHAAAANVQITEIAYGGKVTGSATGDGEYVEITNEGDAAADLTGWSYATGATAPTAPGGVSLSSLGTLAPGESAIVTDLSAAEFRTEWDLASSVKVVSNGGTVTLNSGPNGAYVFDAGNTLVDKVTYVKSAFSGKGVAKTPAAAASSQDLATGWTDETVGDAEGSWTSASGAIGSPGASTYGTSTPASVRTANVQITEIAYGGLTTGANGGDGEYVEITNEGKGSQDLTGWSYATGTATPTAAGPVSLASLGTLAPGASAIITDLSATEFRTEWGLKSSVPVLDNGKLATLNSGASAAWVLDGGNTVVDTVAYPAKGGVGAFSAKGQAMTATAAATSQSTASGWALETVGDAEGSWASVHGAVGSPGASTYGTATAASVRTAPAVEDPHTVVKIAAVDATAGTVTLHNTGTSDHDISGWTIQDTAGTVITIPAGTTLAAGTSQTFTAATDTFDAGTDVAQLYDGGTLVDSSSWNADPNWADVTINEVSSDNATAAQKAAGDPMQDAIELYNKGDAAVDLTGWKQIDSGAASAATTFGPIYVNGSATAASDMKIPAHGYAVFSSKAGLSSGGDGVKLYLPNGTLVDSLTYGAGEAGIDEVADPDNTITSVAACPDGSHTYLKVKAYSFGASNATACASGEELGSGSAPTSDVPCTTEAPGATTEPVAGAVAWPGSDEVSVADDVCAWDGGGTQQDLSGLVFDPTDPNILWAVKNKSVVYKLTKNGGIWQKVTTDGWANGKNIRFPGGSGLPDSEGMTVGPDGALYITTERDNASNSVPLDSILRFDPTGSSTTLTATDEWNLTGDLFAPDDSADANLGFEGVTYVPDSYLTANGFIDDNTHAAYTPATYAGKVTAGLFFAAVEKTGHLEAYALNADHSYTRVADIATGMAGVMDVSYDAGLQRIWAQCDNTCGVSLTLLEVGADGHVVPERHFSRPAGLPDNNLEGFAVAPVSTAVDGEREVVWSDDGNFGTSTTGVSMLADAGGHSLWTGRMDADLELGPQGYDATAPVVVAHADPAPNAAGWNNAAVTVTYTCTDTGWGVDDAASDLAADTLTSSGTASGTCVDLAGNTATATYTAKIDTVAPSAAGITIAGPSSVETGSVRFTIASSDADVTSYLCRLDGVDADFVACTVPGAYAASGLAVGSYTLEVEAVDQAGNVSAPARHRFAVVAKAPVTVVKPVVHPITGKPKVGKKLKVAVTVPSGATVSYQWYAGGKKIKHATKRSLKVTKALRKKRIKVRVTIRVPGQPTVVQTMKLGKAVR